MKSISDMWLIQIEITNACHLRCANCTRFTGHHSKPFFMDLEMVERAIDSLKDFPGGVGIIGGEPTLHPQFEEICLILKKKIKKKKRWLWTSGHKWETHERMIKKVFGNNVFYNDHSEEDQTHQPILISIDEVVEDKECMWNLIDNCWIQNYWSASITPKGGFFCEVAAAMDMLFDGPGGFEIKKGWWRKSPEEFIDQIKEACPNCSAALPLPEFSNKACDMISPRNLERLKRIGSPRISDPSEYKLFKENLSVEQINKYKENWKPWHYLGEDQVRSSSVSLYGNLKKHGC